MSVDEMIEVIQGAKRFYNIASRYYDPSDSMDAIIAALKAGQAMREAFSGDADAWTLINEEMFGDGMEAWDAAIKESV